MTSSEYNKQRREVRLTKAFELRGCKCEVCGITDKPRQFYDWHHKDPSLSTSKTGQLSALASGREVKFWEEVDRCMLLCPNCHREEHLKEGMDYQTLKENNSGKQINNRKQYI
jgi:predicted HNH restriction endonuclease